MQVPIKNSQIIIIVGVLVVIGVIAFSFFQVFQATPPKNPEQSSIFSEPKTIGVMIFPQQKKAFTQFKEGMKELGYTNITYIEIEKPPSPKMMEEIAEQTKKLVREDKVDLIYAGLEQQALAAINATKEIGSDTPIVYTAAFHDPVTFGLAKSFSSSGNNATGVSVDIAEILRKQFEFIKKIIPNAKKFGVFGKGFVIPIVGNEFLDELKRQTSLAGYKLVEYTTDAPPPKAEEAWHVVAAKIKPGDIDGSFHMPGHYFVTQEREESKLATRLKFLMVSPPTDLGGGGHFGYNGDFESAAKQTTKMVDKIFRGTKPRDIPLERIEQILMVLYPVRARSAGIEFPESIRKIADKISDEQ